MGLQIDIMCKVENLMTLAKKALVLLKRENTSIEPKVSLLFCPNGETTLTFVSSCFPFFHENGFETISLQDIDKLIEKCTLYVNNLEKNIDMTIQDKEKNSNKINDTGYFFYVNTKDKKFRLKYRLSKNSSIKTNELDYNKKYVFEREDLL